MVSVGTIGDGGKGRGGIDGDEGGREDEEMRDFP
jgi:hypothetical protein